MRISDWSSDGALPICDHIAQVRYDRFGQVASPVDAGVVEAFLICAANEVAHVGHCAIRDHGNRLDRVHGAQVAGHAAPRKSVVEGKSGSVSVDLGGGRSNTKKTGNIQHTNTTR